MAEDYLNPAAGPTAAAMMKAALAVSKDLNATTEAAAVITVVVADALARQEEADPDEVVAYLVQHARAIVEARRAAGVAIAVPGTSAPATEPPAEPSEPRPVATPLGYRRFHNHNGPVWIAGDAIENVRPDSGKTRIRMRSGDVIYVIEPAETVIGAPPAEKKGGTNGHG